MKPTVKKILVYLGIILFFLLLSYGFMPELLGGKVVNQSDITGYQGMAKEMHDWNRAHPQDPTYWTDNAFGGMPTTTFADPEKGDLTQSVYKLLLFGKRPASYLFVSLLGAFLLMLSLGLDLIVAVGGAIAISFCSYNFQIIQVGHNTKMQAIAFLPWALAALVFTYRAALGRLKRSGEKKRGWLPLTVLGAVLFALAISLQIKANHQQISYYLLIMILLYAVALFIWLLADRERRKCLGRFFAASFLMLGLGLVGVATNANKLIPIMKYTPQSMRGGSELQSASNTDGGLTIDYATAWSYGWEELPNLMIPNFNGGSSSQAVDPEWSKTYELFKSADPAAARNLCQALPAYWGPQPFTAGPMYMGAITIFLFVLGLFFCRGKEKWWLLTCTILMVLLSLGCNFIWFTKLFYKIAPLYNKFRTVSMALVVLQLTLPMLACILLDKMLKGGISFKEFKSKGLVAYLVTGGVCLLFALIPSLAGDFSGSVDSGQPDYFVDVLRQDRQSLLVRDALRSFIFISAAFLLLLWSLWTPKAAQKSLAQNTKTAYSRRRTAIILVFLLVLGDLFFAGKRYLNSSHFVTERNFNSVFNKYPSDEAILQDSSLSYRVLDLSAGTFSDSRTSYWHKSVGGYSPAKLQRYQELIESCISPEINTLARTAQSAERLEDFNTPMEEAQILNALNTKYIILAPNMQPYENPYAFGNVWFVDSLRQVSGPDEALASLQSTALRSEALLEPADAAVFAESGFNPGSASDSDEIELVHYAPNELRFHYKCSEARVAVFSEVYYPEGWHAWLADSDQICPDVNASAEVKRKMSAQGVQVPLFRADWIFRAAVLPAGEHNLIMRYDPESVIVSKAVSTYTSIALLLLLLLSAGAAVLSTRKDRDL